MKRLVPRFTIALSVSLPSPWPTPSLRRDRPSIDALDDHSPDRNGCIRDAVEPDYASGVLIVAAQNGKHDR